MPRPSPVSDEVGRLLASGERHAWSLGELLESVRRQVAGANYSSVFRAVGAPDTGFVVSGHHVVFVGRCPECSVQSGSTDHVRHPSHPHHHGPGCGHMAVPHGDHTDYVHGGHRHAAHGDHWDEH